MKREQSILLSIILMVLFFANVSNAQLWSGIIDSSRATDWSGAGNTVIDESRPCNTTLPAGSSSSTIQNAIAAAPAHTAVCLSPGTYNVGAIDFNHKSNVTLRGAGADQTFLNLSSTTGYYHSGIAIEAANLPDVTGNVQNSCSWTAGYAPGSRSITLSSCSLGSVSNLRVGNIMVLDQLGDSTDPGQTFNCISSNCEGNGSGSLDRSNRPQQQTVTVASCDGNSTVGHACSSGTNIGISPAIRMPNWRSGQSPQAFFSPNTVVGSGVEDMSIDGTNAGWTNGGTNHTIGLIGCLDCWVSGVRSLVAGRGHVGLWITSHAVVRNNYFYGNEFSGTGSYGIELAMADDNLIVNNIVQAITDSAPSCTGGCTGNVMAYNYGPSAAYGTPGWFIAIFVIHAGGDAYNLWEGNTGNGFDSDDVHGTHHFQTLYRNRFAGWQSTCDGAACSGYTSAIVLADGSRYFNVIGNVLGTSGYHTYYQCASGGNCSGVNHTQAVYDLGNTVGSYSFNAFCQNPGCTSTGGSDPLTPLYLMRWGNYDTVNNSVRWVSSEVPSGLSAYANPVPSSQALPASLYYSSKPAWFGNVAWPPIGPDVTGGNLANVGGHANMIPSMACAVNVMMMPQDGTGGALSFNAKTCYGSSVASGPTAPAPPNSLTAIVN